MMTFVSWSRISAITRSSRAPGQTPVAMSMSAAGPVATPGRSTPTSAERNQRPHKGSGGLDTGGTGRRSRHRLASVNRPGASRAPRHPRSFPMVFLDVGMGHVWDHSRLCHSPASALPCPAGRSVPGRGGPERQSVRDRTGPEPAGTRWVHAEPAGRGLQRARAVTTGAKDPQVRPPAQPPPGTMSGGGPEFEFPRPGCREPFGLCPPDGGHRGRASGSCRAGSRHHYVRTLIALVGRATRVP
jgi:hypothetical protein